MFKLLLSLIFSLSALNSFASNPTTDNDESALDKSVAQDSKDYSINTLYALLVAEMAGQRQLFDVALGNYLLEAHRTQDPGVAARATQIAQYILSLIHISEPTRPY